jgi:hypothetical protein
VVQATAVFLTQNTIIRQKADTGKKKKHHPVKPFDYYEHDIPWNSRYRKETVDLRLEKIVAGAQRRFAAATHGENRAREELTII